MTQTERDEIVRLKESGKTYKEISDITGICISTVKSVYSRTSTKQNDKVYYCKQCGKKLLMIKGKREKVFCSDKCRMYFWRTHKKLMNCTKLVKIECPTCHIIFNDYEIKKRKYCCWNCFVITKRKVDENET